jgi:multisubunit Na+/H+ antiporter MnhB subunit
MSRVEAAGHISGLGLAGLYCLAIGAVLVLTGFGSLATRRQRGRDARVGQIRVQERLAGPQLRFGAGLVVVGLIFLLIWWIALR